MVGYTPQLSTAVWVGTDKGTALLNYGGANVYGSGLPAQIWKAAMDAALDGEPLEDFPEPDAQLRLWQGPYEPPPTTYTPPADTGNDNSPRTTSPAAADRNRPQIPMIDEDGGITLAPGVTSTVPGAGGFGNGEAPVGMIPAPAADNNTVTAGGDDRHRRQQHRWRRRWRSQQSALRLIDGDGTDSRVVTDAADHGGTTCPGGGRWSAHSRPGHIRHGHIRHGHIGLRLNGHGRCGFRRGGRGRRLCVAAALRRRRQDTADRVVPSWNDDVAAGAATPDGGGSDGTRRSDAAAG